MFAITNASQGLSFFPDDPKHHQFDAYPRTCSNHIRADTLRRFYVNWLFLRLVNYYARNGID
jgi:hypothetical protein